MEFLNEKINILNSLIQQFTLEQYQNKLIIVDAEKLTGDTSVDQQLAVMAQNSKGVVLAMQRRIDVRKEELVMLNALLEEKKSEQPD